MNTLLVSLLRQPRDNNHAGQPLGVSQIAGSLYEEGFNVYGLDLPFINHSYSKSDADRIFKSVVNDADPDIIGISLYDLSENTIKRTKELKKMTNSLIVGGGQVPTLFPYETLETLEDIDVIVIGEGEDVSKKMWKTLEKNNYNLDDSLDSLRRIEGVGFRANGERHFTGVAKRITNLDELPVPKRDIFPAYFIEPGESYEDQLITGSRSCRGNCVYCGARQYYAQMDTPNVIVISDERILEDIDNIANIYKKSGSFYLQFVDEDFFISSQRMESRIDLLEKVSSEYGDLIKSVLLETRIDSFDSLKRQKNLEKFKNVNMRVEALVGVDHTRDDSLKFYNRLYDRNQVFQGIDTISEIIRKNQNFEPYYSLVPYHPDISFEELKKFFEDLKMLNDKIPFRPNIFLENLSKAVYPIKDTPLFGYLKDGNNLISDFEPLLIEPYPWLSYTYEFRDNKSGMVANLSLCFSKGLRPTLNADFGNTTSKEHELDWFKEMNSKILQYYKKTLEFLSERDDFPEKINAYDIGSLKKIQRYFMEKGDEISNYLQYKVDNGPTMFEILNSDGIKITLDENKDLIILDTI